MFSFVASCSRIGRRQRVHIAEASYGFQIAGGQGELTGKVIRFSHMGYVDAFDTLGVISALEMCLAAQGYKFEPGSAVAAAQRIFARG